LFDEMSARPGFERFLANVRLGCVALVLVATALLTACGSSTPTLNDGVLERAIAGSILNDRHVHTRVQCPPSVPRKAGHVFTCTAHLDAGTYPVTVTETNASGHVRFENTTPLVILDIEKVKRAITRSMLSQRHLRATVDCPQEVLQKQGVAFACIATAKGRKYYFLATETDGKGHVKYVRARGRPLP
jgi:hypothetical protein